MADIGNQLRSARLQRGLTIEQVAQETRISARFLEALEGEEFEALPAPVYVRGFLRSYANFLRIDPQPLLDQLAGQAPMAPPPPEGFTTGPGRARPQAPAARDNGGGDPFRRRPAAAVPPPLAPPNALATEPAWEPEYAEPAVTAPLSPPVDPRVPVGYEPDDDEEAGGLAPAPRYRRTEGVLAERPPRDDDSSRGTRVLVIIAAAVLGLGLLSAVALVLLSGGDDTRKVSSPSESPTPSKQGSVVAVGSATPKPSASVSPSPTASPSPGASPSPTGTPTPIGTNTPGPTATPTQPGDPTQTPTPTPTTEATPTSTPTRVPTPTPTATIAATATPTRTPAPPPHAQNFGECIPTGTTFDCSGGGSTASYLVVCDPGGSWFVDVGRNYPKPASWASKEVPGPGLGAALTAGAAGCQ